MLTLVFVFCLFETKVFNNATWLKIFHHDSSTGQYFNNFSESLNCNSYYKYSIIGKIDQTYRRNGKFEFLLEYPELNGYNQWKQTYNPKDNPEIGGTTATGYESVNIGYSGMYWGGLVVSNYQQTAIDGSTGHLNWFYSIGCYSSTWMPNKFPGPALDNNDNWYAVSKVLLWVRTNDTIPTVTTHLKNHIKNAIMFLSILIL